jgi:hypothetical protein
MKASFRSLQQAVQSGRGMPEHQVTARTIPRLIGKPMARAPPREVFPIG